jgi:hypothetical protein
MTVGELIKELQKHPLHLSVMIDDAGMSDELGAPERAWISDDDGEVRLTKPSDDDEDDFEEVVIFQ